MTIKCNECGSFFSEQLQFCPNCGCPAETPQQTSAQQSPGTNPQQPLSPQPNGIPVKPYNYRVANALRGFAIFFYVLAILAVVVTFIGGIIADSEYRLHGLLFLEAFVSGALAAIVITFLGLVLHGFSFIVRASVKTLNAPN